MLVVVLIVLVVMYRGGSRGGEREREGGGGGGGGAQEVRENGRLGSRKQELYVIIKLFYWAHIAVKSIVGQFLFNATVYRYDVTVV